MATGEYEVIVQHGWFHRESIPGVVPPWEIIPTNIGYDDGGKPRHTIPDRYGEQSIHRAMQAVKPDILWTLADPFMIKHLKEIKEQYGVKVAAWMPIDGVPVPDEYTEIFQFPDLLAGITKWGTDLMEFKSGRKAECFYHGVDFDTYHPMSEEDRLTMRKEAAVRTDCPEDALLLGWVGKNQFRKMPWIMYPVLFYMNSGHWAQCSDCQAITLGEYDRGRERPGNMPTSCSHCNSANIRKGDPVVTRCWSHMYPKTGGIDFAKMEKYWNVKGYVTYSKGIHPGKGVTGDQMNELYNLVDVYTSLSGGEGFGIPIIEAAACAKPVLYTDYSGQAEVGELVAGIPVHIDAMIHEHHTQMNIDRAIPSVADVVKQLQDLKDPAFRKQVGQIAYEGARHYFDWNVITNQWHEALKRLHATKADRVIGGVM